MQGPLRHGRFFVWVCRQVHEGTQMAFTGSTMPRRDVFFAGTQSDLIPFNMSRSSNVRKFSRRVFRFQYIFSRQNKLVFPHRASKKITRVVPLRVHLLEIRRLGSWNTLPRRRSSWHSSLLVVFSPRHLFVFVVRMQCISVDFTSCGLLIIKEECWISSLCSPLVCCRMQGKRIDYCKIRIEICFLAKNSA